MPTDAELGTPSGTFTALPQVAIAYESQSGLSGTGTLNYGGRRYRFEYAGMNATGFASQVSPVTGEVFNLKNVRDFAGTYTATAVSPNHREAVAKNENGVVIRLSAMRPITGGLQSITIRLTR